MRIAIVNDVPLAREILRRLVLSVQAHSVAWQAENGEEAVRRAIADPPDVILMDLIMPVMDGAEATRQIMARAPCPILLVTSSVSNNHQLVLKGLGNGGLDAVNTPTLGPDGKVKDGDGILSRLDRLARSRQSQSDSRWATPAPQPVIVHQGPKGEVPPLVLLGASTGGPEALASILSALPAGFPAAVVVIQHLSAEFAVNLVTWLGSLTALQVEVARAGEQLRPGVVYVAVSDDHLVVEANHRFAYTAEPRENPFRPSVDVFFQSVTAHWPRKGVAVVLTGMGSDGARGLLALRKAGWFTIAQDKSSSVVYGMPAVAANIGAACRVTPLPHIAGMILNHFSLPNKSHT